MEERFKINFELNGKTCHADVALRFQELDVYYVLDLGLSETPEMHHHLMIEMNNSGEWQQKNTGTPGWQISNEMINSIGAAIEASEHAN